MMHRHLTCRQPVADSCAAAGVQVAMEYLFKGIVPPELPPVPVVELRQCDRQRMEKMIAHEVCTPVHPYLILVNIQACHLQLCPGFTIMPARDWACRMVCTPVRAATCICIVWQWQELGVHFVRGLSLLKTVLPSRQSFPE